MKSITCHCEHVFNADLPDQIDLDSSSSYIADLKDGVFFSVTCPSCGIVLKPEFPLLVEWKSKKVTLQVIPELDRADFYKELESGTFKAEEKEVVVGYPELSERVCVLDSDLDPNGIEAIKFYLLRKAEEAFPESDIDIWFMKKTNEILEFHISGIRADEIAISNIPLSVYQRTMDDYSKNAGSEPFRSLRVGPYLSIQNVIRPDFEDLQTP